MTARLPRGDDGFTLPDVLMALAITAILVPALAGGIIVFYRAAFAASARGDQAHDANLVASYLQPDLASAETAAATGTSCPGGGSSGITLSWSQPSALPNGAPPVYAHFTAAYSAVAVATTDGPYILRRTYTAGGGSSSQVIAHNLTDACAAIFDLSHSPVVSLSVTSAGDAQLAAQTVTVRAKTAARIS
jgi:hypothetical protein